MTRVRKRFSAKRLMIQLILGGAIAAPLVLTPSALAGPPSRRYPAHRQVHRKVVRAPHRVVRRAPQRKVKVHIDIGRRRTYCPPPRRYERPVYVERVVRVEHVQRVEHVSYPAHDTGYRDRDYFYGLNSRGWDDLRYGHYVSAKQQFRDEIEWNPRAPALEIGYSMATGRLEHFRESIRSMRRAVNLDVDALIAVRDHCDLRSEAERLLDQYRELVRYDSRDVDALFMSAAIESILGNWRSANRFISDARQCDDSSSSTRELQYFIESHLKY